LGTLNFIPASCLLDCAQHLISWRAVKLEKGRSQNLLKDGTVPAEKRDFSAWKPTEKIEICRDGVQDPQRVPI